LLRARHSRRQPLARLRTIVPIETTADKHASYHYANLTDLQLKYADVVPVPAVVDWFAGR
jgi:hypothetical protein